MYLEEGIVDKDATWSVTGSFANAGNFMLLTHLLPSVKYKGYLMQARLRGNGVPSEKITFETPPYPPSMYPIGITSIAISATEIFVSWDEIPIYRQNGALSGYKIRYRKYFDTAFQEKVVPFGYKLTTLEHLVPFTLYWIDILAFNIGGNGPPNYAIEKTLEGVPSVPVPNIVITDMQSVDWWSIRWGKLPQDNINGILKGYRLIYYMSYRSDIPVGGEVKPIVIDFDKFTFYHKVVKLVNYATYNVTVTGYTNAGNGPTPQYYAKTCKCNKYLFCNWYHYPPYAISISKNNLTGLFTSMIYDMTIKACQSCQKYTKSYLFCNASKSGADPDKKTVYELKRTINADVDVSFPYYDRVDVGNVVPGSVFVPVISSVGCGFIVRDELDIHKIVTTLIINVFKVWPLLIVAYAITTVFGILIWFTDQFSNPDEFTIGSSIKGPCIGFWFAFVTMTTVGYGDVVPRSHGARIISTAWILTGLVLNGIIIGFITTALTSIDVPDDVSLYNTKTAALNKSYESRYAVRRNAKISDVEYTTIDDMLDDLQQNVVDAVLVDLYAMVGYKDKIREKHLKLKSIIDTKTGYGFILSGFSKYLKPDIESMIFSQQEQTTAYKISIENEIPSLQEEQKGDLTKQIFDVSSFAYQETIKYLGLMIGASVVLGVIYELIRCIRNRVKVAPEEIYSSSLQYHSNRVKDLKFNLEKRVNYLSILHTQQLTQLSTFHQSVRRHKERIGKEATKDKINQLWKLWEYEERHTKYKE